MACMGALMEWDQEKNREEKYSVSVDSKSWKRGVFSPPAETLRSEPRDDQMAQKYHVAL